MGQCYSVMLKAKIKDADEFVRLSREYAAEHGWSADYMGNMSDIAGIIRHMVSGDAEGMTAHYVDGWPVFRGDYDASYCWETELADWFCAVAPSLEDFSEIEVCPDEGHWNYVVKGGVAK